MTVELLIHFEVLPDGSVAWWADADELPGFAAQAPSLNELILDATRAVREIAHDRGLGDVTVTSRLIEGESATMGWTIEYTEIPTQSTEGDSRAIVGEPRKLAVA